MKILATILACIVGAVSGFAGQLSGPLNITLHDKVLILRGMYRTENLHFAADGSVIGVAEKGFGATDATFHVRSVAYAGQRLVLRGDLPVMYFEASTRKLHFSPGVVARLVTIDVGDKTQAEAALWKVFFKPGEREDWGCTDSEKQFYQAFEAPGRNTRRRMYFLEPAFACRWGSASALKLDREWKRHARCRRRILTSPPCRRVAR